MNPSRVHRAFDAVPRSLNANRMLASSMNTPSAREWLPSAFLVCTLSALGCGQSGSVRDGGVGVDSEPGDSSMDAQLDAQPQGCGGAVGANCADTEYCDYAADTCGAEGSRGVCRPWPDSCPFEDEPVCACDGVVYGNACRAKVAGQDLNRLDGCETPAQRFPCGAFFCETGTNYCQVQIDDTGLPPTFSCRAYRTCPETPDCTCAASETCGGLCMADGEGNLTLTCPGG